MDITGPDTRFDGRVALWFRVGFFSALVIYTAVLLVVEWRTSQEFARHYFTDISGPVPFYAVNTSLCTFLLWATSLVFAACFACGRRMRTSNRQFLFYLSQAVVFAWLGLDERFKFHEWAAGLGGFRDEYVLAAEGLLAAIVLLVLGVEFIRGKAARYLAIAVGLAALMFLIDALAPHDLRLRLSVEDLAKTWAGVFLFLFAWQCFQNQLDRLAESAQGIDESGAS